MSQLGSWIAVALTLFGTDGPTPAPHSPRPRLASRARERFAAEPQIVTPTGIAVEAPAAGAGHREPHALPPRGLHRPPADRIRRLKTPTATAGPTASHVFEGTKSRWTWRSIRRLGSTSPRATSFTTWRTRRRRPGRRQAPKIPSPSSSSKPRRLPPQRPVRLRLRRSRAASTSAWARTWGPTTAGRHRRDDARRAAARGEISTAAGPTAPKLERIATGFWNPFHWRFDTFGRLFTVDNDPDSRPPCRLLHIVAGRRLRLPVPQRPQGAAPVHRLERRAARHAADGRRHRRGPSGVLALRVGRPSRRVPRRAAGDLMGRPPDRALPAPSRRGRRSRARPSRSSTAARTSAPSASPRRPTARSTSATGSTSRTRCTARVGSGASAAARLGPGSSRRSRNGTSIILGNPSGNRPPGPWQRTRERKGVLL